MKMLHRKSKRNGRTKKHSRSKPLFRQLGLLKGSANLSVEPLEPRLMLARDIAFLSDGVQPESLLSLQRPPAFVSPLNTERATEVEIAFVDSGIKDRALRSGSLRPASSLSRSINSQTLFNKSMMLYENTTAFARFTSSHTAAMDRSF